MKTWIRFLGSRATQLRQTVLGALQGSGLEMVSRPEEAPPGLGVIVFDEVEANTLEAVRDCRLSPSTRVLAVATTGQGLGEGACWRLLQAGASDVLVWEGARDAAAEIAARLERWHQVERLIESPAVQRRLVGRAATWLPVLRQLVEVAAFTDASVLLLGESGTGKEEMACLIHELDMRPDKRELVTLDCTTVVPELSGSEFFGHERGAFTGATNTRDGAFALAHGGTLFLDEVGELPLALQAQLLRVVQERLYKRVGSNTWQRTDFRLVCATNRELSQQVAQGGFRRDFFHRILSWVCRLPPLRERPEDILPLAQHFLRSMRPDMALELDPHVREYLLKRSYPGNIRELRQLIGRLCKRHVGTGPITVGDIPPDELPSSEGLGDWQDVSFAQAIQRALSLGVGLKEIGRSASDTAIRLALAEEQGNLQRAARRLGVTDRALQLRRAQRDE
ncbi:MULTISPECIES: sigma-54 dependent transcriptional regulator [Corallococcus]|uniref:sigma-54-dependent transcriptional regulator n=1 Tax=Corallococcus TaxID=83461 RepID=UPI00117C18AC|nr:MULTISPECIES: sigma 54-interacting transcriptional regulator [Corallococcus]NBD09381.1 AAA domain-containing protein [Corallococcus silvisoli]TSC31341.1 sigma-54-dependent Fis family transcriptional regulator [Corallococcus sp. Z5C101001]